MKAALAPGQIWRHVGYEGVPATGLLVRIVRCDESSRRTPWVCDYPDSPSRGVVRYEANAFEGAYVLETAE